MVKPLVNQGGLEMPSHVLVPGRPNVAPLWYGIAACGQTRTIFAIGPCLQSLDTPISKGRYRKWHLGQVLRSRSWTYVGEELI
jgi:hypothetical protein